MRKDKRDATTVSIGESIKRFFEANHTKQKFDETQLIVSWEKVLGKTIAKNTKKIFIKNKVLFVELRSAALKHELNASKDKIKQLFRNEFGADIIDEIVIM